ncbi:MAG TPA: Arm DNA-binding domain-containing protein, partial [Luteibaculaceae bacterium]|nr:Arm DNA-binding domain-containing protein [Luteibaculaceae bacterium]
MTRQKNAKPNVFKYTAKFVAINLRKNGMLSLYLQVFINRERLRIPLNIFVKPEDWIANREIIVGSSPENADLNLLLQGHKAKLHDVIMYFRLRHKTFDKHQFLERFNL